MHQMQTTITADCGVCQSVCLSHGSTRLYGAKTAKRVKMLFGVNNLGSPQNKSPDSLTGGGRVQEDFVNYGPIAYLKND